jgi:hypothetical protein
VWWQLKDRGLLLMQGLHKHFPQAFVWGEGGRDLCNATIILLAHIRVGYEVFICVTDEKRPTWTQESKTADQHMSWFKTTGVICHTHCFRISTRFLFLSDWNPCDAALAGV